MRKVNIGDTIRIIRMEDAGGRDTQAAGYAGRIGTVVVHRLHRAAARHLGRPCTHSGSG